MSHKLTDKERQNAHFRLRKKGCTAFHAALKENNCHELLAWIESGVAPLNRVDREGRHPLVTFIQLLNTYDHDHGKAEEAAPGWWMKYPSWGGEAGWAECRKKKKMAEIEVQQTLAPLFVHGVDWAALDEKTKKSIREHLPSNIPDKPVLAGFLDQLLGAGMVLAPFTHQGMAMSMSMWSLIRPLQNRNVDFWIERENIDPPEGPGFLSVLLAVWKMFEKQLPQMPQWVSLAMERGANQRRPTLHIKPQNAWDMKEVEFESGAPAFATLKGQAEMIDSPVLSVAMAILAENDRESMEIFHAAMQRTKNFANEWRRQEGVEEKLKAHLCSLLEIFPNRCDEKEKWLLQGMHECLLLDICCSIPPSRFQILSKLIERLDALGPPGPLSKPMWRLRTAIDTAISTLSPQDTMDWMTMVLQRMGPDTYGEIMRALVGGAMDGNSARLRDRCVDMLAALGGKGSINHAEIDPIVFGDSLRKTGQHGVKTLLDTLAGTGYAPKASCWIVIAQHLIVAASDGSRSTPDPKVALVLGRWLHDHGVAPEADAFKTITNPVAVIDNDNGNDKKNGYSSAPSWTPADIEKARQEMFEVMILACSDLNDRTDGRLTPLDGIEAGLMDGWKRGEDSQQRLDMIRQLIDRGARQASLPGTRMLPEKHPYWVAKAWADQACMEAQTPRATGSARARRL